MFTLSHHTVTLPADEYIRDYRDADKFIRFCHQCERYNNYWSCPPFDFDTTEYISDHEQAHIIGTCITFDTGTRAACTTVEQRKAISLQAIESTRQVIDPHLLALEGEFPGSIAFYAGTCHLCPTRTCTRPRQQPCRYPREVRHSLESMGFDIGKTASLLLDIELLWSNTPELPEYLTLVSGFFTPHALSPARVEHSGLAFFTSGTGETPLLA